MRIVVAQPPAGDQRVGLDESLDDRFVGVAEIALVIDDALAFEAWCLFGEIAVGIDGEGNLRVDASLAQGRFVGGPDFKVVGAMTWSRVHEASAGVLGDMFAGEQWHVEVVTSAAQRMGAH